MADQATTATDARLLAPDTLNELLHEGLGSCENPELRCPIPLRLPETSPQLEAPPLKTKSFPSPFLAIGSLNPTGTLRCCRGR